MQLDIIPRSFWNFPSRFAELFDEDANWRTFLPSSGLTVSEDDQHVYIEAAVPGIDPEKIEATFDKGILWIRGEAREEDEDKKKKFYRKASRAFSYRVAVPGAVDEKAEPEVKHHNGLVTAIFNKLPETEPKKLKVKSE